MKFVYPDIARVFDTDSEKVNTLVIENQPLLYALLSDLQNQLDGLDGRAVVSEQNKVLPTAKNLELLTAFVPFDLNRKNLVTKVTAALEKNAVNGYFQKSAELMGLLETFLSTLAFDFPCDICYPKLSIGSVLKAAGVEIRENHESLGEKLVDYMELVTEFDKRKLYITLNLRSFISDAEASLLMQTVLSHGYALLMLESSEHPRLPQEQRYIVDKELCEIQ